MSMDLQLYQAAAAITAPAERERMAARRAAVERIHAAGRGETVDAIAREAAVLKLQFGSMKTVYYTWVKKGEEALVDGRKKARASGANLWVEPYKWYAENDKNTSTNGWNVMMRDFRAGTVRGKLDLYAEVFRAIGTWQDVWAKENPGKPVPANYPSGWVPSGATYQSLRRLAKRDPDHLFQLAACRQGRRAAHKYLVEVIKTRRGVPVGAIRQWDDVWHNTDIRMPGSTNVAQPLEFAGYDVASAYKADSLMKPRFTRLDGKRDNLKEQTFRFLVGYAHCVTGFHKGGILNVVEWGTAAIRDDVRKQIALIPGFGNLIKFTQSGILSEQVHAGLFVGGAGGNFRMKALCESSHGKIADRTAHLPGNRGRDAETMHESRGALVRNEERLMRAAEKLPADVAAMLEYGLVTFDEYHAAFRIIEREWMRDPIHNLEGWDDRQVQEYSLAETPGENDWHNVRGLLDMAPDDARAIAAFLTAHPDHVRQRYLSRHEFWMAGQADIVRVPLMEMPAFLDERDMIELTVRDNGTVDFRNGYFYGRDKMIYRVDAIRTPAGWATRFEPGRKIMAKYNPLTPEHIWIINAEDGATIGMAPLHARAPMMDQHAIEVSLGVQSHDLARKVLPVRGRHQADAEDRAGRIGRNQAALLGLAAVLPLGNATVSDDAQRDDDPFKDVPDAMDVAAGQYVADAVL